MSFQTIPMCAGDLYDAAHRFAINSVALARAQTWNQIMEMGWPAVLVPEARGGAGGTLFDLSAIVEATGRQALDLPLIERCAVAPTLLANLPGPGPGAGMLLERIAALTVVPACAIQPGMLRGLTLTARADGEWELDGMIAGIDMSVSTNHSIVHVPSAKAVIMLDAEQMPAPAMRYRSVDGRETGDLVFDRLRLPASALLARGMPAEHAVDKALDVGALMSTVELTGALGALIEQTIAYLKTRVQFGVHLSTFQALRHRVVEMYVQYESASGLVARIIQDSIERAGVDSHDVSLAKAYLGKVGRFGAEAAIQLHGGMGMTEELLAARLARRMLSSEFEYGDRFSHLTRLVHRGLLPVLEVRHDQLEPLAA